MSMQTRFAFAAAVFAAGASVAMAQQGMGVSPVRPQYEFPASTSKQDSSAGSVQLGDSPFYLAPFIGAAIGQDSNLFQTRDNEKDSVFYVISPGFKIDARGPSLVLLASYLGGFGYYKDSRDDDYQDHTVRTSLDWLATREAAFHLGYDFLRAHDARGSTDRPSGNEPDVYELSTPTVLFAYGQKDARGRVEAWYSDGAKRYKNNREFTVGSDRDTKEAGVTGYFRVAPKTSILVEYRKTDLDYKLSTSPLSGEEERIYAGVTWDATAAVSGTIKAGQLKKRFNSPVLEDFSGTGWEGLVTWMPRTYSKVDVYSYRQPVESTGIGTFVLSEATGVSWQHGWSSYFSTEAGARFQKDKYQGNPRSDDIWSAGLKANYKFRPWLTLGAEYLYTNRDSNQPIYEFDRHIWFLTAVATL
ncbi:outer membrane beta-barrel protein [Usitatibacter palustris]|uniref:Beta-barrel porin 2 n=1 Tax=Usitatibacter palustris TaxID=2732487 RepID=A0A6M4HAG8_9PROT|nr:outer membrane beta-barrel protein [Usitatibacter palustris]QJR15673.1 hypothetical protein DSM104440_02498 [Usitatibacter palustris]